MEQIWHPGAQTKNATMSQYEIPAFIEDEMPSVTQKIKKLSALGSVYKIMEVLKNYTKRKLLSHDLPNCNKMPGACR